MIYGRAASSDARLWGPPFLLVAVAATFWAALSGVHPTGTPVLDPFYAALMGAAVTLASWRASRGSVLWLAVIATVMSRNVVVIPAAAGLILAFASTFPVQAPRLLSGMSTALSVQAVLRWHSLAFHGATALVAVVAVAPVLFSAWRSLPARPRRLTGWALGGLVAVVVVLVVPLLVVAAAVRGEVAQGETAARSALSLVGSGDATAGRAQLVTAAHDFGSASSSLDRWWTAGARLVPVAAQQRQALVVGSTVARQVASVAGQQAARVDFGQLHYTGGGVDLSRVDALAAPLATVDATLAGATTRIEKVTNAWIVEPVASRLAKLTSEMDRARTSDELASTAVQAAPSLLGADGARHYFVAFQDPAESRGLGGLLVWYGELTVDDGHISLSAFGDALNLEAQLGGRATLDGPPGYVARYGRFNPQKTFIDVTYSPDLPTVTDVVSQLYTQLGHPPIDGMLVLDPASIATLVGLTGAIDAPGLGVLDGSNTAQLLERGQYAMYPALSQQPARKAALDGALKLASQHLSTGSLPGIKDLVHELEPDVKTGDLMFWSVHPADQALLEKTGLAGRWPPAAGADTLSVVTQNAANNKIDAYLQRTISDQVSYDPATGAEDATVTLALHNSAPASGLSDQVIASYPGSGLAPGSDLLWFSVYSPLGAASATIAGRPLQLSEVPEFGLDTFSGYVAVPSGATSTVVVHLSGKLPQGATYRLVVHQQPTILPDRFTVTVSGAGGWRPAGPGVITAPPVADTTVTVALRH